MKARTFQNSPLDFTSKLCRATVPMCANSSSCSNEQFLPPHPPSALGNLGWETGNAQKLDSSPHLPGSLNPLLINHLSTQRLMDLIILQTPKWFWYGNWHYDKTELRYQNVYQNPRFKSHSFPRFSNIPKTWCRARLGDIFLGGEVWLNFVRNLEICLTWYNDDLALEKEKRKEKIANTLVIYLPWSGLNCLHRFYIAFNFFAFLFPLIAVLD